MGQSFRSVRSQDTSSILSSRIVSQCRDDVAKRRQGEIDGSTFFQAIAGGASLVGSLATRQIDQIDQRSLGHFLAGVVLVLLHERDCYDRVSAAAKFNRMCHSMSTLLDLDLLASYLLVAFMFVAAMVRLAEPRSISLLISS